MRQERRTESKQLRAKRAELVELIDRLDLEILQATGLEKIQLEDRKEKAEREKTEVEARLDELASRPGDRERTPYVGLNTYQEADADLFYGRDKLVTELVEKVGQWPFLAVLGPSGSGKSSVVRAGLIPELKDGVIPDSENWLYATLKPGVRPLDALATALASVQIDNQLARRSELLGLFNKDKNALLDAAQLLVIESANKRIVFIIDQFEELWTLTPVEDAARQNFKVEQREPFIRLLLTAIEAADTPLTVIITMRADFLHRAAKYPDLARQIQEHLLIVSPMKAEELESVIIDPALESGGNFEPGLVQELVGEVEGIAGALPLLEYTLLELWKRRNDDDVMTWEAYQELGGVEGALAATADDILEHEYTPEQQNQLRLVLLKLIQPGEGSADTHRRMPLHDLVPAEGSVDDIQDLLKPLTDERLITTGWDKASGHEIAEVSHEALIRAWPTLAGWIDDAREDLRFQLQVEEEAKRWQIFNENPDYLLRGLSLANAEAWLARAEPQLTERERLFLDASSDEERKQEKAKEEERKERERLLEDRAEAERRNSSRLRLFLTVGAVLLAIAIAVGIYAFTQQLEAERLAETAKIAAQREAGARQEAELAAGKEKEARTEADLALEAVQRAAASEAMARQEAEESAAREKKARNETELALVTAQKAVASESQAKQEAEEAALRESLARQEAERQALAGSALYDLAQGRELVAMLQTLSAVHGIDEYRLILSRALRQVLDDINLIYRLRGHSSVVWVAEWSPDNQFILSAGDDFTARVWDAKTGEVEHILTGHSGAIRTAAWSPDGAHILTGSDDGTARLWDATSGKVMHVLEGHENAIKTTAWSPDGDRVATGSMDNTARVWEVKDENKSFLLEGHSSHIWSLSWSPDGEQIVTASADKTARVWSTDHGELNHILRGHEDKILTVVWSPDGTSILTGSLDNKAIVWNADTGEIDTTLEEHEGGVWSVAWSPDSKYILTGSDDHTAIIWYSATGANKRVLRGHSGEIYVASWSPDGEQILTASRDSTVRLWDARSGAIKDVLKWHHGDIWAATWSLNSNEIITGSDDGTVGVWNADHSDTFRIAPPLSWASIAAHSELEQIVWRIFSLAVDSDDLYDLPDLPSFLYEFGGSSPDGEYFSVDYPHSNVGDIGGEQTTSRGGWHTGKVVSATWSTDDKRLLTGSEDRTARIWDIESGQIQHVLEGHLGTVTSVAWSPDNKLVLTGGEDSTARVWDAESGQYRYVMEGHLGPVISVVWSPDSRLVLTQDAENTLRVWDAESSQILHALKGHTDAVISVVWSQDDKRLLTGSMDSTARIWDIETGEGLHVLEGHTNWILSMALSPDGKQVLTGGIGDDVRVWDTGSGGILHVLESPTILNLVAWSPDGKQVLSRGEDDTARVWIMDPGLLVARLTERVCNIMGDAEIRQEIPEWRGCEVELEAVAEDLAEYKRLMGKD